jgi:hypothetical protein
MAICISRMGRYDRKGTHPGLQAERSECSRKQTATHQHLAIILSEKVIALNSYAIQSLHSLDSIMCVSREGRDREGRDHEPTHAKRAKLDHTHPFCSWHEADLTQVHLRDRVNASCLITLLKYVDECLQAKGKDAAVPDDFM